MKILVINGPNLNLLGVREPQHYGRETYEALVKEIETYCAEQGIQVDCFQSNHEGDLVDAIQKAYWEHVDGIVINPGAYTHTSIALLDAVKSVQIPTVEVHISKVEEPFVRSAISAQPASERLQDMEHKAIWKPLTCLRHTRRRGYDGEYPSRQGPREDCCAAL